MDSRKINVPALFGVSSVNKLNDNAAARYFKLLNERLSGGIQRAETVYPCGTIVYTGRLPNGHIQIKICDKQKNTIAKVVLSQRGFEYREGI